MERPRLEEICRQLHWMARRYADGRRSYVTGMLNDMTRELLAAGIVAEVPGNTVWARDGSGSRGMDGLTHAEASLGDTVRNKSEIEE